MKHLNKYYNRTTAIVLSFALCINFLTPTSLVAETESEPYMVADINTSGSSAPSYLIAMGNTAFFAATSFTYGTELWKSDGTTDGTVMVKDINPGTSSSYLSKLTILGNTLYFIANDGTSGTELWKSDGTPEGTLLVKDINPGASSSSLNI